MVRLRAGRASLALTVLFLVALETLSVVTASFWLLFGGFAIALIAGTALTLREDLRTRGLHVLILPLLYVASVFAFHLLVPHGLLQQLFVLVATAGFFFLVARGVEWAFPTWNWFFTSATFFLFTAALSGFTFHVRFPVWVTVSLVSLVTALLSLHVLGRAPLPSSRRFFWSVLLALLMAELLGVFTFLPVSYLVTSGTLFVAFYVALHLLQKYLYDRLTLRLVREYLVLASVAAALVLGTAHWSVI
jgi:uncharacterized protein DUF5656